MELLVSWSLDWRAPDLGKGKGRVCSSSHGIIGTLILDWRAPDLVKGKCRVCSSKKRAGHNVLRGPSLQTVLVHRCACSGGCCNFWVRVAQPWTSSSQQCSQLWEWLRSASPLWKWQLRSLDCACAGEWQLRTLDCASAYEHHKALHCCSFASSEIDTQIVLLFGENPISESCIFINIIRYSFVFPKFYLVGARSFDLYGTSCFGVSYFWNVTQMYTILSCNVGDLS